MLSPLPLLAPSRELRALLLWGGCGVVATIGLLLLGQLVGTGGGGFVFCGLRLLTGIPCPGCGLTRAMAALGRGELLTAWSLHPFGPLLAGQAAVAWLAAGRALLRRLPPLPPSRWLLGALLWNGVGLLALWLGRAATGTLP